MLRSERDYDNKIYILSNIYERTVVNNFSFCVFHSMPNLLNVRIIGEKEFQHGH